MNPDYVVAVLPSLGLGFLFFLALRAILTADRREREAALKWEREQDLATAMPDDRGTSDSDNAAGGN